MTKKILKKIIICIVICIIIVFVLAKEVAGAVTMSTFADKTYSQAYEVSVSTLFSNDWYYDGDNARFSRPNYLCLEKSSTTAGVNFYVCCVIDINSDGTNPNYAKYYYKNSSGNITSKTVSNSKIAELAYISWYADTQASSSSAWACTHAFAYVWSSEHENARALFSNASSLPDDDGQGSNNSIAQAAATYATNGSTTSGKVIKARIILFSGGAAQNTAFIYGTAVDNASAEINKYITSSSDSYVSIGNRSGMSNGSNGEKHASPVKVAPGDTVTYTIVISNSGSSAISVNLEDSFASCLSYVSSTASFTWSRSGNKLTASGVSIPASGMTFTVTLQVSSSTSIADTKYKNEIKLTYNNTTSTADDYIIVNPEISIDKYVTSVSDVTSVANSNSGTTSYGTTSTSYGTTRAGKSVESKKSDPVKLRTWSRDNL